MLGLNVGQTWSIQHSHPAESSKDTQTGIQLSRQHAKDCLASVLLNGRECARLRKEQVNVSQRGISLCFQK